MSGGIAVMAMYPFPSLQPSWEAMYAAVSAEIPGRFAELRWDVDPHDTWLDPELVIGMTCGWPLITALEEGVRVVGTFAYDTTDGAGDGAGASHLYRSVIIARQPSSLEQLASIEQLASARAAINSLDSLSGNVSLLAAFGAGTAWPGDTVLTGAHLTSIDAVRAGAADVASIDGMTWAFQQRDDPGRLDGLVVVGHGPLVPCLPVVLPGTASDDEVATWRDAFTAAVEHPSLHDHMRRLMIRHFVALDLADYRTALALLLARHAP